VRSLRKPTHFRRSWIALFAGIVSVGLIAEFWVHYVVLFRYGIGYPMGLNGIFIAMVAAFIGGLVAASIRKRS
jgi:hypothetical protein